MRTQQLIYAAPIVVGAVFIAIAVRSIKRFFRGSLSPDGVVLSLVLAAGQAYLMDKLYAESQLFHPAGNLRLVSGFMCLFYVWNLFFGPAPLDPPPPYNPPKKQL